MRFFDVDTRAQTRDGQETAVVAIPKLEAGHHKFRHRTWKPHRGRKAYGRTDKTLRSHANHFERVPVDRERLTEHVRAPAERALPIAVAHNRDMVLAVRAFVLVVEKTSMDGGHTQDGKVTPAHHVAPDAFAALTRSEVQRYELVDESARKEIGLTNVAVVREGNGPVLERARQPAINSNELLGLFDGELLEQERLYESKRHRVGADAER